VRASSVTSRHSWTESPVRDSGEMDLDCAPCVALDAAAREADVSVSDVVIAGDASIATGSRGAPLVSPPTPRHAASFRDA